MKICVAALVLSLSTGPARQNTWRAPELQINKTRKIETFEELQEIAVQYLGHPYKMGGIGNPYFDCSGFTCRVFAESGYGIPRVSRDQAKSGVFVPWDQIRPGDLLFYVQEPGQSRISHVTLYVGDRQMIHAASGSGKVLFTNVDSSWYRKRFKTARRYIEFHQTRNSETLTTTTATRTPPRSTRPIQVVEMVEHSGDSYLPITKRLSGELPAPSLGPRLSLRDTTTLGVRAAAISEDGVFGFTVAPELKYVWPKYAVSLALAAPVRFELDETLAFGEFDHWTDGFRFVRSVAVGLEGAELELKLDRLGDISLGGGFLVDRLAPGALASGIPGLSVRRTPLSFAGHFRRGLVDAHLLVVDVFKANVFAGAVASDRLVKGFNLGVSFATDQAAATSRISSEDQRRALNGAELFADYRILRSKEWALVSTLRSSTLRSEGHWGAGAQLGMKGRWRLRGRSDRALSGVLHLGWAGPRFLDSVLGPTYLSSRATHWSQLREVGHRATFGGELQMRYPRNCAS